MLEPEATGWEGFLPEENGGLGWEGERGSPYQESEETVPPGGALLTDASGTSPPCVLRNQEMMSIKGTSQTQRMRWIPTLTSTKGMNRPVMEKRKSREGSAG